MQDNTPKMEITELDDSIIKTSEESNHIKSTLSVIEGSTKDILNVNERLDKSTSLKLERFINALTFLNVPNHMTVEVRRKTSLLNYLKFLISCQENNKNSEKKMCMKCKWVACHCKTSSEETLMFTQDSELYPSLNEKEEAADRMWAQASRSVAENQPIKKLNEYEIITSDIISLIHTDDRLGSENKNAELIGGGKPKIVQQNLKLLGGARPKIVKPPKLRVTSSSNNIINTISMVIRSLNPVWSIYDTHQKCRLKKSENCTFCAIRSLSQRLNEPKREKSIQPHELHLQEEIIFSDHSSNTLESVVNK